jgi:sulfide:quinone oxidoreductase
VLPPDTGWPLPVYELALLAASDPELGAGLAVVTPEPRPLDVFGPVAADALARLLDRAGIAFIGATHATEAVAGGLGTEDADEHGFIPIDEHARVRGVSDVFAAGDATAEPIKQGGLATQQADAAAESIAAESGAPVAPRPYRRVLRGVVLTGVRPLFLARPAMVAVGQDRGPLSHGLPRRARRPRRNPVRPPQAPAGQRCGIDHGNCGLSRMSTPRPVTILP